MTTITIARGDGIGPEIMDATLRILHAAQVELTYDEIEIGKKVYEAGHSSGLKPEAWDSIRQNKIILKAPITTPQGGGYKSLNVTMRKTLGLYANIRPCVAYSPFVFTNQPDMNMVIVRENEEDLYGGIEHQQTPEVVQALKLVSLPGCERIIQHAFEYARKHGRHKVTCMSKDNIMKHTDGLFHKVFDKIAERYPDIDAEHYIIDIGAARIADKPALFDVVVTLNLYGDIVSDIAAEVAGSVGLAGSANIGDKYAMFEAIHGSAPDIAGQDIANPSGLLLAAVQMLVHVGQVDAATQIHNAWLRTIEDGVHTADIFNDKISSEKVGTQAFTQAVIDRLGELPRRLKPVKYEETKTDIECLSDRNCTGLMPTKQELVGVDVFVRSAPNSIDSLVEQLQAAQQNTPFALKLVTNRGTKVWPEGFEGVFCTDHWRCRFKSEGSVSNQDIISLLNQLDEQSVAFIKTEHLYDFDGVPGYSKGQGE